MKTNESIREQVLDAIKKSNSTKGIPFSTLMSVTGTSGRELRRALSDLVREGFVEKMDLEGVKDLFNPRYIASEALVQIYVLEGRSNSLVSENDYLKRKAQHILENIKKRVEDDEDGEENEESMSDCKENAPKRNFEALLGRVPNQGEEKALNELCDTFEKDFIEPTGGYNFTKDVLGPLVEVGLVDVIPPDDNYDVRYRLSPMAVGKLYAGREDLIKYDQLAYQADIIPYETIAEKELFYNPEDAEQVNLVCKLAEPEKMEEVRRRLETKGQRRSMAILCYGGPGTGKTELAKQIARRTKRILFIASASKLNGSRNGESEKNYDNLFTGFDYVAKLAKRSPIMLFNEADGLMSKRLSAPDQACELLHNTLQSMMLQRIETLDGLFIATTNLEDSIDPAFNSRFIMSVMFHNPNRDTRFQILKAHLPEVAPEILWEIATRYPLTGRLIENLSIRCIYSNVLEEKPLDMEVVDSIAKSLCSEEKKVSTQRPKVGFIQ